MEQNLPNTIFKRRSQIATLGTVVAVAACIAFLWRHAASYDFFTDDAFITLRYGRNLWQHGSPVYNLGQHVEGYTSPLWMVLTAFAHAFSEPTVAVQWMGFGAAVAWMLGLFKLYTLADSNCRSGAVVVLFATAMSCPVAAWTMGGLETPLFGALITLSLVQAARTVRRQTRFGAAVLLGVIMFAATMTRPEGFVVSAIVLGVWLLVRKRSTYWKSWLTAGGIYGIATGAHMLWRMSYYGYPLPNTYYIKSSGDFGEQLSRGLKYADFAAAELSWVLVGLLCAAVVFSSTIADKITKAPTTSNNDLQASMRSIRWSIKLLCVFFVVYVIRVGGDFLDLYRFWAPVLPLGFLLIMLFVRRLTAFVKRFRRLLAFGIAGVLLVGHGVHQYDLRQKSRLVAEPERGKRSIEPLGWSRLYARRWAAMGRWIRQQAAPDDWMAVGAAGAMPYYAGIPNLDLFGLCDEYVAHAVTAGSSRPGHQKYAPLDYVLKQRPAFVFINDYTADHPSTSLHTRPEFHAADYRLVEAHLTPEIHGSPTHIYHYFYMRLDRLQSLINRPYLRVR